MIEKKKVFLDTGVVFVGKHKVMKKSAVGWDHGTKEKREILTSNVILKGSLNLSDVSVSNNPGWWTIRLGSVLVLAGVE